MEKGISVIICSYNGADKIAPTLRHLAQQDATFNWEIILIDNASSDGVAAVATNFWSDLGSTVPFRIFTEKKPGKLYAFQTALANANYRYFLICDDDNWLDESYLSIAYQHLQNENIGAVGGQGIAVTESNVALPAWFKNYELGYAVGKQGAKTGIVTQLWGAGLASKVELYKKVYDNIPSFLIDLNDISVLSAEDTEYCLRLVLSGYDLFYDEKLKFKHFIPSERLSKDYRSKLFNNFKKSHQVLHYYYLAIKFEKGRLNGFNKFRLFLITPIRLLIAKDEEKREKQKTILSYLMPSIFKQNKYTALIRNKYFKNHL